MHRAHRVATFGAVALIAWLSGCNGGDAGGGGGPAPAAPTALTLSWGSFDQLAVLWTPPAGAIDGYAVEGRVGDGPWGLIEGQVPFDAFGGSVSLEPATPELVLIGFRVRAFRGGQYSAYAEATLLRGVRPPSALAVHAQIEDVALSWTHGSSVAEQIQVERAVWDFGTYQLGPYQAVATLPASATSWRDTTTAAPGVAYSYRISNEATYQGAQILSLAVEQLADSTTTLSPPAGLQAEVVPEGVQLTWTPTSRNATVQQIERTDADVDTYFVVTVLPSAATSYLDSSAVAGGYRYRVAADVGYGYTGWAASIETTVFVAPAPGPWGLVQDVMHVPFGDGYARGASGTWWIARHWTSGGPGWPADTGAWTETASGWTVERLGGGVEYLVEPGIAVDGSGRPHVLWLKNVDPNPASSPLLELRHAWRDGGTWNDEAVAQRVFSFDNLGYAAQLALDGDGAVHVIWEATEVVDSTMLTHREHATNAGGSWAIDPIPMSSVDTTRGLSMRLSVAGDGSVHVGVLGWIPVSSSFGILHVWKPSGGSWTEEVVPTPTLAWDVPAQLVARGAEDLDVLYAEQPSVNVPVPLWFQARTAGGWGSPQSLGERDMWSGGNVLPRLAVSPDGTRRAALLGLADGLSLATWTDASGWEFERIHQAVPYDVPWLAFDAGGALDVVLPGGPAGSDGFVDRIHLRSSL
jgi:hypothetical protein